MTGAAYKLVPTSEANRFKMTPAQLRAAITPRSRLVMLNSPSNPTGTVYTRAELEALADVILNAKLGVISDEIYEKLVFGDAQATCFATLRPGLADRTITISGVSKSYAMTGWRIGWAIAPLPVAKAMGNVQSQETSCPSSVSQYAAIAALDGDQSCVEEMRREFQARRDLVCRRLCELPGIVCPVPEGAFYAFFNVSAHFGKTLKGRQDYRLRRASARPPWKRCTSTSCRAPRSAWRATRACRLPRAGRFLAKDSIAWRSFCRVNPWSVVRGQRQKNCS